MKNDVKFVFLMIQKSKFIKSYFERLSKKRYTERKVIERIISRKKLNPYPKLSFKVVKRVVLKSNVKSSLWSYSSLKVNGESIPRIDESLFTIFESIYRDRVEVVIIIKEKITKLFVYEIYIWAIQVDKKLRCYIYALGDA